MENVYEAKIFWTLIKAKNVVVYIEDLNVEIAMVADFDTVAKVKTNI